MAEENKTFKVNIITPDRIFCEMDATMIEFTTADGDIGVYPGHIPLTVVIVPCIVTIHTEDGNKTAAIYDGFAEIKPDGVTLLPQNAEWPDEIDVDRAKAAQKRAEDRLAEKHESLDIERAELALRRALIRLDIANK